MGGWQADKKAVSAIWGVAIMVVIVIIIAAVVFVFVQKNVDEKEDIFTKMKNATYNFSLIVNKSNVYILNANWSFFQISDDWYFTTATLIPNDGSQNIDVYLWYNTITRETKVTKSNELIDLISEVPNYIDDWAKFFGVLENREKINVEVECPHCNLIFIVENVEW